MDSRGSTTSAGLRRYRGGCQCGVVLWEVALDPSRWEADWQSTDDASAGSVWQRSVPACQFSLLRGHDAVSGYQFFDHSAHHFFCVRCGVHSFSHHFSPGAQGSCELYTIDLRCVHPHASRATQNDDGTAGEWVTSPGHAYDRMR